MKNEVPDIMKREGGLTLLDLFHFLKISRYLPVPDSIDSVFEMNKRALIGWIAYRMAHYLQMEEKAAKSMIFLSFLSSSFADEDKGDEKQYVLYLSSLLLDLIETRQDVYMVLRELKLKENYHECLLKVYEEIKNDIVLCLPSLQPRVTPVSDEQDEIWEVYRDVIYAATQKKLLLIKAHEVSQHKQGKLLFEVDIKERTDIPKARELTKENIAQYGFSQTEMMNILLVISEAITNILKHASEGKMSVYEESSNLTVVVEDCGPGIPLKLLPNATLLAGYSTKKSLGQGFTLMLKMAEKIFLSTTSEGTTVILKFNRQG